MEGRLRQILFEFTMHSLNRIKVTPLTSSFGILTTDLVALKIKAFECRLCKSDAGHVLTIYSFCRKFKNITILESNEYLRHTQILKFLFVCILMARGMTLGYKHIGFVTKAQFLSSKMSAV